MEVARFTYESASCRIEDNGYTWLTRFVAKEKRVGHGTGLMKAVVEWADANDKELCLVVGAYEDVTDGLTEDQLISFYQRYGFEIYRFVHPIEMVRQIN